MMNEKLNYLPSNFEGLPTGDYEKLYSDSLRTVPDSEDGSFSAYAVMLRHYYIFLLQREESLA